ncbi:MAG: UDP-N-acetylglucosamine 2-epimerase (non-hydrolyzing) [Pseudomonadota bacterium]
MKICFVFGTRPEAIKLAPLILKLKRERSFLTTVCVTSQHRHLLDQVLDLFEIKPDIDFDLMEDDQDLTRFSSRALGQLGPFLDKTRPSLVIVHGDTTTAVMTAIAAAYKGIPIAHVEAGLRSFHFDNPFPEEINRVLIDRLADICFAPTSIAKQNLLNEGISSKRIFVTGNTVVDSLKYINRRLQDTKKSKKWTDFFMDRYKLNLTGKSFGKLVLITAHRRESFGKELESICHAIHSLLESRCDIRCVFPVHPNPNVRGTVRKILSDHEHLYLVEPLEYEPLLYLLARSALVLTDSGGIQEEAPSFGVPVIVMRKRTERPELAASGMGRIVGTKKDDIVALAMKWLDRPPKTTGKNPFGDGRACERILKILKRKMALLG